MLPVRQNLYSARRLALISATAVLALGLAGCANKRLTTGSIDKTSSRPVESLSQSELNAELQALGSAYTKNTKNPNVAMRYAAVLQLAGRTDQSLAVMRKAAILSCGPYDIPNVQIDTYGVYTNNTPSGAFRTFGGMQAQFATESHLDICAEKLGLDPFEIRRINMMRDGAVTHTQQKLGSVSIGRVMEAAEKASRWEAGPVGQRGPVRGDLGGEGTRQPCTLGSRIKSADGHEKEKVA